MVKTIQSSDRLKKTSSESWKRTNTYFLGTYSTKTNINTLLQGQEKSKERLCEVLSSGFTSVFKFKGGNKKNGKNSSPERFEHSRAKHNR